MTQRMKTADVVVGERSRKDMGDIAALAASIRERGQLLQPIAVWPDGTLAAGERRLLAVKELGWSEVPVHVLRDAADLLERLKAERDENTCRKPLTPTEAVREAEKIAALEREEAKRRQQAGRHKGGQLAGRGRAKEPAAQSEESTQPQPQVPEKFSGSYQAPDDGRATTRVAEAVGMSRPTYEKAKAVVEAAAAEPEKYGDLPEVMDRTGKVDGAFREMKRRQDPPTPKPAPRHPHSDRLVYWLRVVASETLVIDVEEGGIGALLAEPEKWDPREVREYVLPMLDALAETIARYRKEISDHAH